MVISLTARVSFLLGGGDFGFSDGTFLTGSTGTGFTFAVEVMNILQDPTPQCSEQFLLTWHGRQAPLESSYCCRILKQV